MRLVKHTRWQKILSLFTYVIASIGLLLSVGTFAWQTPGIGLIGSLGGYLPGWLVIWGIIGAVIGIIVWWQKRSKRLIVSTLICAMVAISGIKIISDQHSAITAVGVNPSLRGYFGPIIADAQGPNAIIEYGPVGDYSPRMAVYMPSSINQDTPVIVHVHGGAWMDGNETSDTFFTRYLADQGFLVFSPTYTLANESLATWNIAPREIACAIETAFQMSLAYGTDATRLYITGSSAGGNLATLVANQLSKNDDLNANCGEIPRIDGVAVNIPAVDPGFAAGNPFAFIGDLARHIAETYNGGTPESVPLHYQATNAANFLHADAPPTLLIYGETDWLVPKQAILTYVQQALAENVEVKAVGIPWTGHLMGLNGAASLAISELTVGWFNSR